MTHSGIQACVRSETVEANEYAMIGREFKNRMKTVMKTVRMKMFHRHKEEEKIANMERLMMNMN